MVKLMVNQWFTGYFIVYWQLMMVKVMVKAG